MIKTKEEMILEYQKITSELIYIQWEIYELNISKQDMSKEWESIMIERLNILHERSRIKRFQRNILVMDWVEKYWIDIIKES